MSNGEMALLARRCLGMSCLLYSFCAKNTVCDSPEKDTVMSLDLVTVGVVVADVMVRPVDELPPRGSLGLVPSLEMHLGGLAGVGPGACASWGGARPFWAGWAPMLFVPSCSRP